jgi:outer membrane protein TolC
MPRNLRTAISVAAMVISASTAVRAQDQPLTITIRDAIMMGIGNNQSLQVEKLAPAVTKTYEAQALAAFDPVMSGQVSREKSLTESDSTTGITNINAREVAGNVTLDEFLPTGTKISVEGTTDLLMSSLYSGDFDQARAGVSITQSLLKGGWLGVNMATLREARLDTRISEFELRGFAEGLVAQIESAYWNYALAQQQIEIYSNSLKLAEQQLEETRSRIEVGKLAKVELASAEAEVAQRKEGLIDARSGLELARLGLLRLLNPPSTNLFDREVVLADKLIVPDVTLDDVSSHVAVALRMRPDLNQARLSLARGELEVVRTRNGLLPRLDLFVALGNTGYATSFSKATGNINGDFYDYTAGLQFAYPIGNRDADAQHRRAELGREQAAEALTNMAQLVELDVRSAYIEINRTREQTMATAATARYRDQALQGELEKYRVGKSTSLLVGQAERDLLSARIQEVQTTIGYIEAIVNLYLREGSLLERRGLTLSPRAEK